MPGAMSYHRNRSTPRNPHHVCDPDGRLCFLFFLSSIISIANCSRTLIDVLTCFGARVGGFPDSTTVQSPPKSGRTRPGRRGFTRVDLKPVQSLGPLDCDAGPAAGAIPPSLSTNLPSSSLSPAGSGGPASSSMSARFGHLSLDDHADRPDSAGPNTADPSADSGRRSSHALSTAPDSAKASFRITVGDPHKVGDLATSHTEYQIRTVVCSFFCVVFFRILPDS